MQVRMEEKLISHCSFDLYINSQMSLITRLAASVYTDSGPEAGFGNLPTFYRGYATWTGAALRVLSDRI